MGISIVAIKLAAFFEFVELEVPFPASNKMLLSGLFIYCFITRPPCNQYSEQIEIKEPLHASSCTEMS